MVQKLSRPSINQEVRSSAHYFLVQAVLATIDLAELGPNAVYQMPRSLVVLGETEGALVVMRNDDAVVVLPVTTASIGLPYDVQAWKLLTSGITATIATNRAGPAVTFTGSPAATSGIIVEITTTGALNVGAYRYSLDSGATWSAPATLPAGGTAALGASGIIANFAAGTYTDGDYYMAHAGVTNVTNILINW